MDPNLFHIDWERLFEVLVAIVVASFLVERALALLFESRFFIRHAQGRSLKELIAFIVGAGICWYWDFDAFSMIFLKAKVTALGTIITGAIVAGGSKASLKLFRDVLGLKSSAEAARLETLKAAQKGGAPS
ncbi:MAG: hypothetical protein JRJ03_00295 [Deltaproteobacteria bacterium]|nr:hypothetical protein [Deltaproteobacteria bacterium]